MAGAPVPGGDERSGPEAFAGLFGVVLLLSVFTAAVTGKVQRPASGDHPAGEVAAEGFAVLAGVAVGGHFAAGHEPAPAVRTARGVQVTGRSLIRLSR